ncbi:DUF4359 domain-containing protein [Mangrovibacillus cuniculi]|uniref:DUF4359 domain-containing protein n=1 Tax=Mangrovibacillus cuniculi TaxID=2593652 RepID=A0A7S8CAM9_9BACI|nr:DUF4359 domain-containing protein [Mangrovibacillus cuniculi]QPC46458.1 DUF4359 domain-containing protein [Mangrovibacillus cuniculi]
MKRRYILVLGFAAFVLLFALNNPKQEEYVEWAAGTIFQSEGLLQNSAEKHIAAPIIQSSTKTYNLVIFSLYETKNPINGETTITVGLFNQFF